MNVRVRELRVELVLVAVVVLLGVAAHHSNRWLDEHLETEQKTGDVGPLPDGRALRVLSLGFDRLVADLFWLRTVYYVGDERSHEAGYPAAERLAQLVTDIDPSFRTVYVLMSGALSGLRGDPDAAIRLLEKGAQHVRYWKIHFLLGFNYFLEKLDYARAAEHMKLAASMDGGPFYLPLLSARLYAQAGDPETALSFIRARLSEAHSPQVREALEKRYWDLWITRDLAQIDGAIDRFRERAGRAPESIDALVQAGLLNKAPSDPKGGAYSIRDGRAATELDYEKLEVHHGYSPRMTDYQKEVDRMREAEEAARK